MNNMYSCPMHSNIKSDKPGKCSICGMDLVQSGEIKQEKPSYTPLFTIIGLIFVSSLVFNLGEGNFILRNFISSFMAGFFLVFGGFKLLDLRGFADGYSTYDLLARRFYHYGFIYPFIELAFAFLMMFHFQTKGLFTAEFAVMGFSGLGVVQSLMQKRKIQCVCLGTVIKIPLTSVTLVEDFGMAALALLMLLLT